MRDMLRRYYRDPFGFVDNLNLVVKRWDLNFFRKSQAVAAVALKIAVVSALLWLFMGFDSSPGQLVHALTEGVPAWIRSGSFQPVIDAYRFYYGKEVHGSAFVIYGLMFWALSSHFDQGVNYVVRRSVFWQLGPIGTVNPFFDARVLPGGLGISKSRNIAYSTCLTALAVGSFEMFWIGSFAFFQGQPWIISWQWPQARILAQNLAFISVGLIGAMYMWADSFIVDRRQRIVGRRFCFNLSRVTCIFLVITVAGVLLWWFYPWQTQQVQVQLTNGQIWISSPRFPQTLYTIKTDPTSLVNAGSWFWIQDDVVHGLNTLVKIFWSLAILNAGMLRRVKT